MPTAEPKLSNCIDNAVNVGRVSPIMVTPVWLTRSLLPGKGDWRTARFRLNLAQVNRMRVRATAVNADQSELELEGELGRLGEFEYHEAEHHEFEHHEFVSGLTHKYGLVVKIKRKGPGQTAEICARPSIRWVPSV